MNFEISTIRFQALICPFNGLNKSFMANTLAAGGPYVASNGRTLRFLAPLLGPALTLHAERPSIQLLFGNAQQTQIPEHSKGEYFG